jgi:hypothetical protein
MKRTIVGVVLPIKDAPKCRLISFPGWKIELTDWQRLIESWFCAEERKATYAH